MSRDEDKLIRQLSLLSFLLSRPRPFTAGEVQESVEGYAEMSDETFARRFHADRRDLAKIGIEVRVLDGAESAVADEAQLYFLSEGDFRLPGADFSAGERRALSLALAALEGRFAYARPLRLALAAILGGGRDPLQTELELLPVAFAPDEDARLAGRQLSRLEDAVTRGKTVRFSYPATDGSAHQRTLDPYSLFLIQGHWYVVGRDHLRDCIRTFRLGRIQGTVSFVTEKTRDFEVPADYDPEHYRARPPWLIGPVQGQVTLRVGEDLSWWVHRLEPHVSRLAEDDDGCATFTVPYSDQRVLLSWIVGLGGCAELLEPEEARDTLRRSLARIAETHAGTPEEDTPRSGREGTPARRPRSRKPAGSGESTEAIAPEHLARAMTLLYYLVDEKRPDPVTWQALKDDLGLTRGEVENDLALINLVNFGGGTYALTAEAGPDGVHVVREVMADTFAKPARLSPVMARALLLALDLVGGALPLDGTEALASVRRKVRTLVGEGRVESVVIVDDVVPPDPEVVEVLSRAIREHLLVDLEYYTKSRQELGRRQVEPYLLFHSPAGWYLEAYCLKAGGQRTFKLERIRAANATDRTFALRREVDLTGRRAGQAFSSSEVVTWATVCFQPQWRTYLEEQGTECRSRPDGRLEARLSYLDERWVAQEIVRYLGDAVLERPLSARRLIEDSAAALARRYGTQGPGEAPASPYGGDL